MYICTYHPNTRYVDDRHHKRNRKRDQTGLIHALYNSKTSTVHLSSSTCVEWMAPQKTYIPKNMNLHMYYITQLNHNGSGRNKMTCNFANMTILLSGTIFFSAKFISYLLNCRCSTAFTQFVHAHSSVYFFDILHTFEWIIRFLWVPIRFTMW